MMKSVLALEGQDSQLNVTVKGLVTKPGAAWLAVPPLSLQIPASDCPECVTMSVNRVARDTEPGAC
jgi:hypothetical protein